MIDLGWLTDRLCEALRWHLANPGKQDGPEVPPAGRRVWSIFLDLHSTRANGFGPTPIAYSEIEAWSRLRREPVRPFELDIIRALDAAFLDHAAERKEGEPAAPAEPVSSQPLTPALFKAVVVGKR